jgi:DNA polymerase I-like protein with 3'-5' exonuclease and polymerase domains
VLVFWTAAGADQLKKTIGATLSAMRPNVPEHAFEQYWPGKLVEPGPGDVVVVCGTKPLDVMKAAGLIKPKNRTLNSLRQKPLQTTANAGSYMFTFDPQVVNSEPEKGTLLDWDVRLAHRWLTTGSLMPKLGEYRWVNTFRPLIERIEAKFAKTGEPVDLSTDTETMGLHPWYPDKEILMIGFTDRPGHADMLYMGPLDDPVALDPDEDIRGQVEWLLTSPKIKLRLSNGKYDMVWIAERWGIECTNFKFDNALVGSLLNENRSNSLNLHAKTMTEIGGYDDPLNDKYDKGHMEVVPLGDMQPYFGGDLDACYRVADVLRDELLEDPQLAQFYITILHPASRAFEKVERRGLVVDLEKYTKVGEDLDVAIKESQAEAWSLIPNKIKYKFKDKVESAQDAGKSPLTTAILHDYFFTPYGLNLKPKMFTEKTQAPSTAKAHLSMFNDNPDAAAFCKAFNTMNAPSKTKSTFVVGFLKHLRPDGLLHPSYMLHHGDFNDDEDDESGSTTGRLACKEPSFNTTPKKTIWAKRLRECFIAPDGKVIVMMDYSQGELKIVACLAPEPTMLAAYAQGLDLHAVTGAKLGGYSLDAFLGMKETDPATYNHVRDRAKPANFGLLYRISPAGFQAYCWAQYGLALTLEEATDIQTAFFQLYPGLLVYHEDMIRFVKRYKHVRSPLGRVRHLDTITAWDSFTRSRAERQAINSPVQSTLTDMMIWAIADIEREIPEDKFAVVGMIHDAFMAYADIDTVQIYAPQAQQIMQNRPFEQFGWSPQLTFTADAEYGPDMAHLSKLKIAA